MNRITGVATSATSFRPIGMIGKVGPEAEETEAEDISLAAKMAKIQAEAASRFTETELAERERTFQYLTECKERKRLGLEHPEREQEARERARAAVDRILEEDAERSARESEEAMSEEAMPESDGVGIGYSEDENGKLVKQRTAVVKRTPARRKTRIARRTAAKVKEENAAPPRQFTQEDLERVNRTRCRYTRAAWLKRLRDIAEGKETVTETQYQAHIHYGRSQGCLRPPAKR